MYKSELQYFCQKKQWQLPRYEMSQQGPNHKPNFIATVKVNDLTFQTPNACPTYKQAQDQAALLAFQHFSALDPSLSGIGRLYKNKLNHHAQVKKLSLPVYSYDTKGPAHDRRFRAKVSIDGKEFESPGFFSRLKDAEQEAAKVALASLLPDEEESVPVAPEQENKQESAAQPALPLEPESAAQPALPLEPISEALNNMNINESSS